MKKKLFLLFVFISVVCGAQNSEFFQRGETQYKAENYQAAITSWMQVLETKNHSANLYFNLGNAHYKLNNIGPSIYYYEKALRLNPTDSDIRTNLTFAENARIDAIEPLPKTVFNKWYLTIAGLFTFDGWAILTVILLALFVLLFLTYYFSYSERKKRLLFVGFLSALVTCIIAAFFAFKTHSDFLTNKEAIVFSESVEVKTAPTLGSENAFVLHEGTKVKILETDERWHRIQIMDGKDGWLPISEVKQL